MSATRHPPPLHTVENDPELSRLVIDGRRRLRRLDDAMRDDLAAHPVTRCAKDITPRDLMPLWDGVLWLGKPTLLVADPGLGKSMVTIDIAARVSRGMPWPCESAEHAPADVLMLSAEDDPDDTIVPRLTAAGADLERVSFFEAVRQFDREGHAHEEAVSLDQHIDALRTAIVRREASLVIIDPIAAFLGATDSRVNSEVRALLAALGRLAAELRVAVLVVSHLNKANGANAVYRITGSLAFVVAARAVFAIARDPERSERRLMLPIKNNLGRDTEGYAYAVSVADFAESIDAKVGANRRLSGHDLTLACLNSPPGSGHTRGAGLGRGRSEVALLTHGSRRCRRCGQPQIAAIKPIECSAACR
jgi:putative DNA primase/helicase